MPKKQVWEPKTQFKQSLYRLTRGWGVQKEVAGKADVATSSLSAWADPNSMNLPNVEQAYFIAQALDQNLMDMLGGDPQPRTERMPSDEQDLLSIYRRLPAAQKRILRQTAETFAAAVGIPLVPTDSSKQEQAG